MLDFLNRHSLAVLFFISLFLFGFELSNSVLPAHDSMMIFQYFDFVYSHYYQFNEIPRWLPNSGYGLPAFLYQLSFLNINKYLVMLAGIFFDIQNTLLLYKISLFLDRILFLFGVFMLSTLLYKSHISRWYLCLAALASVSVYYQPFFNFYLFYFFPILLYLALSFLKTGKLHYLVLALFIGSLHFCGHTIYFIPLQFYILLLIFLLYSLAYYPKRLHFGKLTALLFLGSMIFAASLIYLVYRSIEGMTSIAYARSDDFSVSLVDFVTFAQLEVDKFILGYLTGSLFQYDNTFYIGLLPFFLIVLGIIKSKSIQFWIFILSALFVLSFSIGGYFSTTYYYLPGMDKYRHIGLVFGIFSLFILIASGFVIEEILIKNKKQAVNWLKIFSAIFFVLILFDVLLIHEMPSLYSLAENNWLFTTLFLIKFSVLSAIAFLYRYIYFFQKYRIHIFASFFILDAITYQFFVIKNMPKTDMDTADFVTVKQPDFSKPRFDYTVESQDQSVRLVNDFFRFIKPYRSSIYDVTFDWAGIGACIPFVRTDRWNPYVLAAVRARGGVVKPYSDDSFFSRGDTEFKRSMGCMSPRFYLAHSFKTVLSNETDEFSRINDPSKDVLIHDKPQILKAGVPLGQGSDLKVLSHSAHKIELQVEVLEDNPALLLHTDAWDPRWSVMVNNQEAPVIRANIGIKAIELRPGKSQVELEFAKQHPMQIFNHLVFPLSVLIMIFCSVLFYREYKKENILQQSNE